MRPLPLFKAIPLKKIFLASQSPRRKQLLEQAEITFEMISATTDEKYSLEKDVIEVPLFLANEKANKAWEQFNEEERKDALVIAADTLVILDSQIIGKPKDEQDAMLILKSLSGKTHFVITGVVLKSEEQTQYIQEKTEVVFRQLSDDQILHYIKKYQPFDKAGAYAIQEWIGVIGIEKINGDYYNVMGLPINKVVLALNEMK